MFTFTNENPQLKITRQVPFDLTFTLAPPAGWEPETRLRLLHCRTGEGSPRDTEIFELNTANRRLTIERSGVGAKMIKDPTTGELKHKPGWLAPLKAELPSDGRYRVRYSDGAVTVHVGPGDLLPGVTNLNPQTGTWVELLFGIEDPNEGVLESPVGWQLSGIPEADEAVAVEPPVPVPPVTPPAPEPPAPPVVPPAPPPVIPPPAPPVPGEDPTQALIRELEDLIVRYAALKGADPRLLAAIQIALLFAR